MSIEQWNSRWEALKTTCQKNDCHDRYLKKKPPQLVVAPPASEEAISEIEERISLKLPDSFRKVVKVYSARVDITWWLKDQRKLPSEFEGIFSGEIRWSLSGLPELLREYQEWISVCFFRKDDPYDGVWQNKFPIGSVVNGDMIAIETGEERRGAVVYLSHDDGEGHGYFLGNDFEDYIDRLSLIGGVGAEDCQWLPFTSSKTSGIEPYGPAATRWRDWFGLAVR